MSSSLPSPQQGLRAQHQINSPYKRTPHSGSFGGVLGDKENAGSEARAAAASAAGSKLALEIAHHLKGAAAAASPAVAACGKKQQQQQQQQHSLPHGAGGFSPSLPSMFFGNGTMDHAGAAAPAADAAAVPPVLPLSPSSTAVRSSNATLDRGYDLSGGGGGNREGKSQQQYSHPARVMAFAHAHAPVVAASVLRAPPSRTASGGCARKPTAAGRREVQEPGDFGARVGEPSPSPRRTSKPAEKAPVASPPAAAAAAGDDDDDGDAEAPSVLGNLQPKRSRSPPVAELTLPPPLRCDDEISREFEAKARRRSAARRYDDAAGPATSSAVRFWPSAGDGDGVGDSGGGDGRWRKLHARGGGGADGPPRLKLSVEVAAAVAAGDHDDVLLSPSCHHHQEGAPPPHSYCTSPVSLSLPLGLESGGRAGRGRARDNVLVSSMDSVWSMGSIDEADARELSNTREEDDASGGDPVARMLLCQSDDDAAAAGGTTARSGGSSSAVGFAAAAATVTPTGGLGGKEAAAVSPPPSGKKSALLPPPPGDGGMPSPHAFAVASAAGGGEKGGAANAAWVLRSAAKKACFGAAALRGGGLLGPGRGADFGDAGAGMRKIPRTTRLLKPVAFRLPCLTD